MNLDNFSWIVLTLLVANLLTSLKLLSVTQGNKKDLEGQIQFSRDLLKTMSDNLVEFRNLNQSIREGLIEIKGTVIQHKQDDRRDHATLADKMKDVERSVQVITHDNAKEVHNVATACKFDYGFTGVSP